MTGRSIPQAGWLNCHGQAISRTTYSDLFAAIGTLYGTGDGSTTFNLPDMRGRMPIGVGQGTGLSNRSPNAKGGTETVALTSAQNGQHNHVASSGSSGSHSHTASATSAGTHSHSLSGSASSAGSHSHSLSGSVGSAGSHTHSYNRIAYNINNFNHFAQPGSNPFGFVRSDSSVSTGSAGSHTHSLSGSASSAGAHTHSLSGSTSSVGSHTHGVTVNAAGDHTHGVTIQNAGSGAAHNNMPPFIGINFVIFAGV